MAMQEIQIIDSLSASPLEADAALPIAMLALMVAMMAVGFSAYTFAKLRDFTEKIADKQAQRPPENAQHKALRQQPRPAENAARPRPPVMALEGPTTKEEADWLQRIAKGPHGAVGRALGWVYVQGDRWAEALELPGPWKQACIEGMLPRLEHFIEVQTGERSIEEWVERDLIAALNMLAQLLSVAAAEAHAGSPMAEALEARVGHLLYEDLHRACEAEGWFGLIAVWPFRTRFDPRQHLAVGSDAIVGEGMVVELRRIGLLQPHTQTVRNLAQVVIGR